MPTDFNELRKLIDRDRVPPDQVEYVKAMCLIQIAQELNEIKNILSGGRHVPVGGLFARTSNPHKEA